jgi:C-terminal processing protease CtpA/Prc
VYSSSEGFAIFAKAHGWATLVGQRTGGDGMGITPFHAVLPESGLIMRYSGENGLNPDGGSNAEYHTAPNITCKSEAALDVCLARIDAEGG